MNKNSRLKRNINFTTEARNFMEENDIEEIMVKVVQRGGG